MNETVIRDSLRDHWLFEGIDYDKSHKRMPVPDGARDMLDIGGSHGYLSVAVCRRHPELRATVLDLPCCRARKPDPGAGGNGGACRPACR